ncbi:MAG TPA: GNAT family N-acetyltransferase [Thermoanaerobaculia bacterium]|nr:GNAT family N-acetyltransferase [Thermoanaerobaculia bacterium]
MTEFREASVADRDAILALRKRCFPDEDLEKQEPRYWDWEFGHGRMFVADAGDRLAAHLGFFPQRWIISHQSVDGMLAVDAMTDPDFRRKGIFQRVAALAAETLRGDVGLSTAFQIRDAVLPPMQSNGWNPVLRAPVLVKMLTITQPKTPGPWEGEALPDPEQLASIGEQFLGRVAHVFRDAAQLRWRFYENPASYVIDANEVAYVVTRRTRLRGYDTVAIVDLAWRPGHVRDGRLLLSQVLARARAAGVHLAAALLTLSHPAMPAVVRTGFLPSPHRFRFLLNVFDERLQLARTRWALSWADTDHL